MAITINAKGTSVPYFKIGKSGVTLYQGYADPALSHTINTSDIWLDLSLQTIKFRTQAGAWQGLTSNDELSELNDVDLTGLADGYFLRYDSTSQSWKAHEVAGGLGSDWGSITENATPYDGYTGDIWQYTANTNTVSHNGTVDNSSNTGAMIFPTGTTAQRPSVAQQGMVRFNSETKRFEGYNGTDWVNIDIVDDWGSV